VLQQRQHHLRFSAFGSEVQASPPVLESRRRSAAVSQRQERPRQASRLPRGTPCIPDMHRQTGYIHIIYIYILYIYIHLVG
jgi:hypothetical protein